MTIWIAFTAGILSFLSPCVLPLVPSYLTYITGLSFGDLKNDHPPARIRSMVGLHSLIFILGFSVVFILLGAMAGLASASVQAHLRDSLGVIQKIGGVMIFFFGLHLSGLLRWGTLLREKRIHLHNRPVGFAGTFLVGIAFAAGWTPCIGPVLGAILAIAAGSSGGVWQGVVLLSFYSAGLGIPLLLSGLLFHSFLGFFDRFKKHIRRVEIVTGSLLMGAGLLLFFDQFTRLAVFFYKVFPAPLG
jgi:cytochrome c-type biogenesis protein